MSFLNKHSLVLGKIVHVVGEMDCDVSVGALMKKLTDINRCLTDTENQFYKRLVISIKYRFVLATSVKYRFTQISTLMIFNRY